MDRSFLADKEVIAASRKFVCIRLATFEDVRENEVLRRIFAPGGILENTVFALLAPNGKTRLVRSGRSPVWAFGGFRGPGITAQPVAAIDKMAQTMEAIALDYPGNGKATRDTAPLPYLADLRLALNVSAADRQALVVIFATDKVQRKNMEQQLSRIAWSNQFVGKAQYVAAQKKVEFEAVKGLQTESGFIVIQPGTFGLTGEVISAISANTQATQLEDALAKA